MASPWPLCVSFTALLIISVPAAFGRDLFRAAHTGSAEVVDGDGLRLHGRAIRLHGIDAPEHDQFCQGADGATWPCGRVATDHLADLIRDKPVTCVEVDRDRYDRSVAMCEASDRDLGEAMVAEGLAWAYLRYSDAYATAEASARQQAIGIWSAANQPPWEYRGARRARPSRAEGCRIKGNISRSGARIYHLPDSRSYAATRISETKGERWFCTEEEARTAGWRPPKG